MLTGDWRVAGDLEESQEDGQGMIEWIAWIDLPSLIIGAILGTMARTWHSYYVKRPKLKVAGGGGSGGSKYNTNNITITNIPGLIGIRLPETMIWGRTIHSDVEWGLVVERSPAYRCRAWLYDKETGHAIKPLWWRTPDNKTVREVTIRSGERVSLMVFARFSEEKLKYFVYDVVGQDSTELRVPEDEDKFDMTREFYIIIHHLYDKKRMWIDCKMTKGFDGRLRFSSAGGGGTF
jgi:hypothetical protein